MSKRENAVRQFLNYAMPNLLGEAIILTRREIDEQKERNAVQYGSGSDRWLYDFRTFRPQLLNWVRENWATLAGESPGNFPWHDDIVIHMWVSIRKQGYTAEDLADDLCDACESQMLNLKKSEPTLTSAK